jgi:hypothetical protein
MCNNFLNNCSPPISKCHHYLFKKNKGLFLLHVHIYNKMLHGHGIDIFIYLFNNSPMMWKTTTLNSTKSQEHS